LVLVVLDAASPLEDADIDLLRATKARARILVANKSDRDAAWTSADIGARVEWVSALRGDGLDALRVAIRVALAGGNPAMARDSAAVTNVRHAALLERARAALRNAAEAITRPDGPVPEEFVLTDLQDARAAFEEVTGARTSEDVLRHIFSRFCIGK
jgi:tRNA modification GTPase